MSIFIPISKTTKRPTSAAKGFSQPGYQGVEFGPHVALRLEGYAVIDCDTMEAAKAWRGAEGTDTPFVVVTARGMHFYYRAIDGYKSNTTSFGDIDLKTGIGSYVMAPGAEFAKPKPGQHRPNESFGSYTPVGDLSELPDAADLPPLPALALEGFRVQHDRTSYDGPDGWDEVPDGAGHGTMLSLAGSLRNLGMSSDTIHAVLDATNEIIMPSEPMSPERVEHYVNSARSWEPGETPVSENQDTDTVSENQDELVLTSFADMEPEKVSWLWEQRIPIGHISLLAGRPGVGKSTAALDLAAAVTVGKLPGESFGSPQRVLIAATEDAFKAVIVPRFIAAGGDRSMIYRIQTHDNGEVNLIVDIDKLRRAIQKTDAKFLILDPLISRMNGVDTNKDDEVRTALEPLAALAEETRLSVLGLMHFNKTGSTDPYMALMASTAYGALTRSYFAAMRDPDDESQYVFTHAKNSLAPQSSTLSYTIEQRELDGGIQTSKINWGEDDPRSVYDIMERTQAAKAEGKRETKFDIATAWLRQYLHEHEALRADVVRDSAHLGISEATLMRAFKFLEVDSRVVKPGGPAVWTLPPKPSTPEEIAQAGNNHGE